MFQYFIHVLLSMHLVVCIYMCYPGRYLQLKVFMEEISLFVSICWPSSRTRTLYFGKRGVTTGLQLTFFHFYLDFISIQLISLNGIRVGFQSGRVLCSAQNHWSSMCSGHEQLSAQRGQLFQTNTLQNSMVKVQSSRISSLVCFDQIIIYWNKRLYGSMLCTDPNQICPVGHRPAGPGLTSASSG